MATTVTAHGTRTTALLTATATALALVVAPDCAGTRPSARPSELVSLRDVDPSIIQEMRYAGPHNFIGRPITGYKTADCRLTRSADDALARAQATLKAYGLFLRVYDCYRPQRAVDDFVAWAKDLGDNKMKAEFYPHVDKSNLFRDDYIAAKSGHSRGSTVDLTIDGLQMGTAFDYFDPLAHTANPSVPPEARKNRLLLKSVMENAGFKNLPQEWWHYTLAAEPFPDRYFDEPIE